PTYAVCARNAWKKLSAMPAEEAMLKYLEIITELYPTWKRRGEDANERSSKDTRPMGPVFSSFIHEEESDEFQMKNMCIWIDLSGQTSRLFGNGYDKNGTKSKQNRAKPSTIRKA
nr:acyl-CoA-binding domain-containing protein 1-like [Tanacetum cinerariifolium]